MGDEEKKNDVLKMPPPPKPLSFEMPKPPVLQPNVSAILAAKKTTGGPSNIPSATQLPPTTMANPFAPRPKSVSPIPPIPPKKSESSEAKMASTTSPQIQKQRDSEDVTTTTEIQKPSSLITTTSTINQITEIPITPMVEEPEQVTSPAVVDVSHSESSKSSAAINTDNANIFTDKIDMSGGLMSWITKTVTESKLLSDVAEKAKIGMETVITTLDPGMKPFLAEHGVIEFALFNCDSDTVSVASDAFTKSGAMAICRGLQFDETTFIANFRPLVLGDQKARKLCDLKVEAAKKSKKAVDDAAIVVIQPFLLEISGKFYSTNAVRLNHGNLDFDAISQLLEVPETLVEAIRRAAKSEGLPDDEYSISVSQAVKNIYKSSNSTWEPGSLPPYDAKDLLSIAFSSVAQQLLRNLAPVN